MSMPQPWREVASAAGVGDDGEHGGSGRASSHFRLEQRGERLGARAHVEPRQAHVEP